jgi:hypothetical protein
MTDQYLIADASRVDVYSFNVFESKTYYRHFIVMIFDDVGLSESTCNTKQLSPDKMRAHYVTLKNFTRSLIVSKSRYQKKKSPLTLFDGDGFDITYVPVCPRNSLDVFKSISMVNPFDTSVIIVKCDPGGKLASSLEGAGDAEVWFGDILEEILDRTTNSSLVDFTSIKVHHTTIDAGVNSKCLVVRHPLYYKV